MILNGKTSISKLDLYFGTSYKQPQQHWWFISDGWTEMTTKLYAQPQLSR